MTNEDEKDIRIEDLGLSERAYKTLKRGGINTVGDLLFPKQEERMGVRNIGRKCLEEVYEKLKEHGFAPLYENALTVNEPGHVKCKKLREIRKLIAMRNNIDFEPIECHHSGPCEGTCPVCDEEIKYLDEQLQKKKKAGEEVYTNGLVDVGIVFEDLSQDDFYKTTGCKRLKR